MAGGAHRRHFDQSISTAAALLRRRVTTRTSCRLLIEYGLTDRLTAISIPDLQHIDIAAPTNAAAHRPRLHRVRRALWLYTRPKTGWYPAKRRCGCPAPTDTSNPAAIGYTDVEADFRVLLGHNFKLGDMPAFFDLEVAERVRTGGYAERIPRRCDVRREGAAAAGCCWCRVSTSFPRAPAISIFGGSYEYYKLQLSAVYTLTPTLGGAGRRLSRPMPAAMRCRRTA